MSIWLYQRPDYVAKLPGPMSTSQCQLYVDRTQKHKRSIPNELSFDNIVRNRALPPCGLQDFLDYLCFVSHDVENLQFYIWLQDYKQRFAAMPKSERDLSPAWVYEAGIGSADVSPPSSGLPSLSPSKKTRGFRPSVYGNIFEDIELGSLTRSREDDGYDIFTGTATVPVFEPLAVTNTRAGLHWEAFTVQPLRVEIGHVIRHYLTPNSPRELNLSHATRSMILRALQHTTHPSAFKPVLESVEATLRHQSHPNFIRWSICNGNKPRVIFVQFNGIFIILSSVALTICLILSHASRWWRLFTLPLWFLGIDIFVAAYKGLCVIIHTSHRRALRPWEQVARSSEEQTPLTTSISGSGRLVESRVCIIPRPPPAAATRKPITKMTPNKQGINIRTISHPSPITNRPSYEHSLAASTVSVGHSYANGIEYMNAPFNVVGTKGHESWTTKYQKRSLIQKIFAKTIYVQEEAVRLIQDRIIWQSHAWASVAAILLTLIIVALPSADVI